MVSVIMPNYNKGKYVKDAIESVLAQTYGDFELVIVDDGSNDESPQLIEGYTAKDPRVILLRSTHRGVSSARNLGIENAHGELITFLDSDDIYHREKLMRQVQAFGGDRNFVSYTDGWAMDASGASTGQIYMRDLQHVPTEAREGNIFSSLLRYGDFILAGSVMMPLEFLGYEKFEVHFNAAEDFDLWVRLAHRFPFRFLPEVLYGYRIYPGNTWTPANRARNIKDGIAIRKKWLKMFDDLSKQDREYVTKETLRRYLIIKDYPGLLGFCLSNRTAFRLVAKNLGSRLS